MKQVKIILLFITALCVHNSSWAQTSIGTKIGDLWYVFNGSYASVVNHYNYSGNANSSLYNLTKYVIPSTVEYNGLEFVVNTIDNRAFSGGPSGGIGSKAYFYSSRNNYNYWKLCFFKM